MIKKIFAIIFLIVFLIAPLAASAQFGKATTNLQKVAGGTGLTSSFEGSISTIITGILSLAGTVFLVLTVYAGILWMTAQGKEEQVTKAKDIVTQAIIGLAITLAAYAITAFVTGRLTSTPNSPPPTINSTAACKAVDGYACYPACTGNLKQVGACPGNTDNGGSDLICCSMN